MAAIKEFVKGGWHLIRHTRDFLAAFRHSNASLTKANKITSLMRASRKAAWGVRSRNYAKIAKGLQSIGVGARTSKIIAKSARIIGIASAIALPLGMVRGVFRKIKGLGKLLVGAGGKPLQRSPMGFMSPNQVMAGIPTQLGESVIKSSDQQAKSQLQLELSKAKAEMDLWTRIAKKVPLPKQQVHNEFLQKISAKGPTPDHKLEAIIELLNQQSMISNDIRKNTYANMQLKIAELEGKSERATKLYQSIIKLQLQQQSANAEAMEFIKKSTAQQQKQAQQFQTQQLMAEQARESSSRKLSLGQIAIGLGTISLLKNIIEKTHENGSIIGAVGGGIAQTISNIGDVLFGEDEPKVRDEKEVISGDSRNPANSANLSEEEETKDGWDKATSAMSKALFGTAAVGAGATAYHKVKKGRLAKKAEKDFADSMNRITSQHEKGNKRIEDWYNKELEKIESSKDSKHKKNKAKKELSKQKQKKLAEWNDNITRRRVAASTAKNKGLRTAARAGGKGLAKVAGKAIPFLGLGLGIVDAVNRFKDGDVLGGIMSLGAGAVSMVPGIGTGASIAIEAALIGKDMLEQRSESEVEGSDYVQNQSKADTALESGNYAQANAHYLSNMMPKYASGTQSTGVTGNRKEKVHPGGPAIVGDGGRHEVIISPDNKTAMITPNRATEVNLPKGSKVIPMIKRMPKYATGTEGAGVDGASLMKGAPGRGNSQLPQDSGSLSAAMQQKSMNSAVEQYADIDGQTALDARAQYLWYLLTHDYKDEATRIFGGELQPHHIAAILGTWYHESVLKPWAYNAMEKKKYPKAYGRGLAQWSNPDRLNSVRNIFKNRRRLASIEDVPTIESMGFGDQLGLFLGEIAGNYSYMKKNFLKADSLEAATDLMLRAYENGPGSGIASKATIDKTYRKYNNSYRKQFNNRLSAASGILNKFNTNWSKDGKFAPQWGPSQLKHYAYYGKDKELSAAGYSGSIEGLGGDETGGGLSSILDNLGKFLPALDEVFTSKSPKYAVGTQASNKSIFQNVEIEDDNDSTKTKSSTADGSSKRRPVVIDNHKNGDIVNNYYNNTTVNNTTVIDKSRSSELGQL